MTWFPEKERSLSARQKPTLSSKRRSDRLSRNRVSRSFIMKIWEGMAEIWCACMCEVVYGGMNVCFCVFVYDFFGKEWRIPEMNVCAKVCACLLMLYIYIYIYIYICVWKDTHVRMLCHVSCVCACIWLFKSMRLTRQTCAYVMMYVCACI
jgi:hypothetical protein